MRPDRSRASTAAKIWASALSASRLQIRRASRVLEEDRAVAAFLALVHEAKIIELWKELVPAFASLSIEQCAIEEKFPFQAMSDVSYRARRDPPPGDITWGEVSRVLAKNELDAFTVSAFEQLLMGFPQIRMT